MGFVIGSRGDNIRYLVDFMGRYGGGLKYVSDGPGEDGEFTVWGPQHAVEALKDQVDELIKGALRILLLDFSIPEPPSFV
jgi:hypothetical protein